MSLPIQKLPVDHATVLGYGEIVTCDTDYCRVRSEWGESDARRAVSCLVEPQTGDRVLLSRAGDDVCFILGILERPQAVPTTLSFIGDTHIKTHDGRLQITAGEGLGIGSARDISLAAGRCELIAGEAQFQVGRAAVSGASAEIQWEKLRIIAGAIDTIADRVSQRLKRCYRWVEDIDQLKAGQLFYLVKNVLTLRSKHSTMTAKGEMKIDGERVHMG